MKWKMNLILKVFFGAFLQLPNQAFYFRPDTFGRSFQVIFDFQSIERAKDFPSENESRTSFLQQFSAQVAQKLDAFFLFHCSLRKGLPLPFRKPGP